MQQIVEWLSVKLSSTPTIIKQQYNGFQIDPSTRTFVNDKGENIYLTAKEFDLLYFLFCHKGQVFTKEQLYENIWGYNYLIDSKNLSSFIRKLKKKIEPFPNNPQYNIDCLGSGYKFSTEKPYIICNSLGSDT